MLEDVGGVVSDVFGCVLDSGLVPIFVYHWLFLLLVSLLFLPFSLFPSFHGSAFSSRRLAAPGHYSLVRLRFHARGSTAREVTLNVYEVSRSRDPCLP